MLFEADFLSVYQFIPYSQKGEKQCRKTRKFARRKLRRTIVSFFVLVPPSTAFLNQMIKA
jgi:hypothetical protein